MVSPMSFATEPLMPPRQQLFERIALGMGVPDVLVLERDGGQLRLIGGHGRGAGWAGVVQVELVDEPHAASVMSTDRPRRIVGTQAQRVLGPYWSIDATLIPVGDQHLVVLGGAHGPTASSAELLRYAAEAVAACGQISNEKLLADELEVVHAVRALMDHRPSSVLATARHIASVAAEALSCEIGAVLVRQPGGNVVGVSRSDGATAMDDAGLCTELNRLADEIGRGSRLEQELPALAWLGEMELVSQMALTIVREQTVGLLLVGHARQSPRGFTLLCQRVGRSLADAAEVVLDIALAHESLAHERDGFAIEARTDPLTGLGNRIAWTEALTIEELRRERNPRPIAILMADLDHLKEANDQFGHATGDELLIAAAEVLRRTVRGGDIVVRLGGDEFAALLLDADADAALDVAARVEAAAAEWCGTDPRLSLRVSTGYAVARQGERLDEALGRADALLASVKRVR
jgi:diguanylate cyclase (GGDEF)-like protein